jgi:hypothetical protein
VLRRRSAAVTGCVKQSGPRQKPTHGGVVVVVALRDSFVLLEVLQVAQRFVLSRS